MLRLVFFESICLGLLAGLLGCLLALAAAGLVNPFLDGGIRLIMTGRLLLLGLGLVAPPRLARRPLPGMARVPPGAHGDHPDRVALKPGTPVDEKRWWRRGRTRPPSIRDRSHSQRGPGCCSRGRISAMWAGRSFATL